MSFLALTFLKTGLNIYHSIIDGHAMYTSKLIEKVSVQCGMFE